MNTARSVGVPSRSTLGLIAGAAAGLGAFAVLLLAHDDGSSVASQTRPVARFSAVELAGSNVVSVRIGSPQSVVVHAREDMLGQVSTRVHGGTLVIGNRPGRDDTKGPMSVAVTVPSIDSLTIPSNGSGIITASGVEAASFTVSIVGSGVVRATGSARRLDARVGGSGDVELGQLTARDVQARVSGAGRILVTATSSLTASVQGDGVIQYGGNPIRLSTSVTGSGVVIPG